MKNKKNKLFSKLQNVFFSFLWTPPTFKPHNFFISNPFFIILIVLDAPKGGLQVLFRHQNQQNPPLAAIL
jgi:hypothetical protein